MKSSSRRRYASAPQIVSSSYIKRVRRGRSTRGSRWTASWRISFILLMLRMMRTVNRLYAERLRNFAMVHDSYGVHACDVDLLHRVLREEFVRIYTEPVLQNFIDQQRKAHPGIILPDPPQTGGLDIQQVLASPYFFA